MCYACNVGHKVLGSGMDFKTYNCNAFFCLDIAKREFCSSIDIKHPIFSSISCLDKYVAVQQTTIAELAPEMKIPPVSLNPVSNCGDSLSEMNLQIREIEDEAIHIHLEQPKGCIEHREVTGRNFSEIFRRSTSDLSIELERNGQATFSREICRPESVALESYEDNSDERSNPVDNRQEDLRSLKLRSRDDTNEAENATATTRASVLSHAKANPLIWMPPDPANIEDDMDSVANNDDDDDDDYNDGTKWVQSSSLSDFDKEHGNSFKEARQKAMVGAMNGQFKILVSRFLASEELTSTDEGHGLGWLDIVTSLSWEAALFIKPDAKEGRAMDPGSYVKVKCVATGARSQSQVIKGLIFKKNAAHKHMPIKCKSPRLLLVKGFLGQHELGLSSFDSMNQEKDYLKSINEMIEACHPNLVLVEKSVSRDVQEFLLTKGMTLAFDMKITRLERIARCAGCEIIPSAEILTNQNLKQCDSFRIEKFVEEHNNYPEISRRSSKTLMFLEGFPKPLGCTILLKGAHIDELKKVKRVIQYTIFAAYHLILETSFFADQRALFSTIHSSSGGIDKLTDKALPTVACFPEPGSNSLCDIPVSNRFLENLAQEGSYTEHSDVGRSAEDAGCGIDFCEDNFTQGVLPSDITNRNAMIQTSSSSSSDFSGLLMPSFSASFKKLLSDSRFIPIPSESISSFFGIKEEEHDYSSLNDFPISPSPGTIDDGIESIHKSIEEKLKYGSFVNEKWENLTTSIGPVQSSNAVTTNKAENDCNDEGDTLLSSESIVVLLSSQCIEKGLVCEQSHLSRIKYYGNFDVSLGRYLQDVLLNQKHACSSCSGPPEAHIYCYTHQNGNLTVLVGQLPLSSSLSGEMEGRIWMWSRCLKCEHENGIPRSTKRVVMSTAARSLSFGKFLELSFTSHSAASRLSSECGHSLHRDCLRFFGLGSKVAMFRYSPVEIYAACKPSPVLEFSKTSRQDWEVLEAKSVLKRGEIFFSEVANFLQKLKMSCSGPPSQQSINMQGFVKSISEVEDMLIQERAEFEASLSKAINYNVGLEKSVNQIPGLGWFNQELLFGLYIWDHRLHQLLQASKSFCNLLDKNVLHIEKDNTKNGGIDSVVPIHIPINVQQSTLNSFYNDQSHYNLEADALYNSAEIIHRSGIGEMECTTEAVLFDLSVSKSSLPPTEQNTLSSSPDISSGKENEEECADTVDHMHVDQHMEPSGRNGEVSGLKLIIDKTTGNGLFSASMLEEQPSRTRILKDFPVPDFEDPESLVWISFPELRNAFKKDLHGGYLQKFSFIRLYTPKYLSPMHQLFPEERGLLHYPVGANGSIMSVHEDEISSIISCALALSEDQYFLQGIDEKDASEGKEEPDKENDSAFTFVSEGSVGSSYWSSSNGSLDSAGMPPSRSLSSFSSDELSTSFFGRSLSVDHLVTSENLHPEIPLGIGKEGLKKYSVVCFHAKQFYALRRMCCPTEQAFISSLSRCRKWDAQGGKSKAFFAKSLDDRFIIKQIKKSELDSFLKFAPDYFKHITHSLSSGSQTCLAKILGMYQVRQNKSGKEVKTDLMVMENLLFGRNVTRTYDLKGAVFSRYITDVNGSEKVLLDQNFVEDMRLSPIYVGGRTKHLLQRAIWNDTSFLNAINVMDYSLLVGVDKQQRQLVFGIIDYLRQYTWDKQLETWVKASLVVPKNSLPTIISPREYKKRFRKFMSRYFYTVPDSWCSTQCSEPCKFCTRGSGTI